ncbi:MAG TPA: hypothetical protein DCQ28_10165 [Bacteroidetes bacterium]|nr:hypothetical protein [Bacteroidota bacterium]
MTTLNIIYKFMKILKLNILQLFQRTTFVAVLILFATGFSVSAQEKPKSAKEKLLEMMQEPKSETSSGIKTAAAAPVTAAVIAQPKIKKIKPVQQTMAAPSTAIEKETTTETKQTTTAGRTVFVESSLEEPKSDSVEIVL